mmetsp:Transcript_21267/g.63740  ORF Transcript_21267/g.63740 Transcript_21267/m.63740 type:complete len:240 (+) Transcript_21267:1106-1825(+)
MHGWKGDGVKNASCGTAAPCDHPLVLAVEPSCSGSAAVVGGRVLPSLPCDASAAGCCCCGCCCSCDVVPAAALLVAAPVVLLVDAAGGCEAAGAAGCGVLTTKCRLWGPSKGSCFSNRFLSVSVMSLSTLPAKISCAARCGGAARSRPARRAHSQDASRGDAPSIELVARHAPRPIPTRLLSLPVQRRPSIQSRGPRIPPPPPRQQLRARGEAPATASGPRHRSHRLRVRRGVAVVSLL